MIIEDTQAIDEAEAQEIEVVEDQVDGENVEDEADEVEAEVVEGDGDEVEQEPEVETFTFTADDGLEYEIPKALEKSLMLERDYTQKNQANAAEKKALADAKAAFEQERQRDQEDFKLQAQVVGLEDQLQKYINVDWQALRAEDSFAANEHFQDFQLLQQRKGELDQKLQQRNTERSQAQEASFAARVEETEKYINANIPNWSPELGAELEAYAKTKGYDDNSLRSNISPHFMATLYDGLMGSKLAAKAKTPPKAKSTVKPLQTIKAKSGIQTKRINLADASMEDYAAARRRGVGG